MAVVRKKQDDKILKTLRELVGIGGNKQCFDCGQKGPTYINMTIGSFVCTTCSGILRGLTPPHRVKSISMATFTQEEIDFVRQNGNDACSRTWLGLWDPKRAIKQEHRDFMIDKYERKRYYLEPASPLKSLSTNTSNSTSSLPSSNGFSSSSSNISSRNGSENVVPLKTITLTPPTSLRLSRTNSNSSSGLNGNGSHTSSSVTNPSTSVKFQQQFSPDDGNFFSEPPKILPPTPQKHSSNHHQRLNGTVNGANFERNQRNGLLTSTSNGNKFTPDSDFVADFSNANIVNIDGTSNGSNGLRSNNNNRLSNGFNEKEDLSNGRTNSDMENFADFEHNAIYNAAEHLNGSIFSNGNHIDSSTTNSSSSTTSVNSMNNDLFINNYSLLNNNNSTSSTASVPVGVVGACSDSSTCNDTQFTAFGEYKPNTYVAGPYYGAVQRSNGYVCFQNYYPNGGGGGSNSLNYTTNQNNNIQWNLWHQFNQRPPNEQATMFGSASSLSCNGQSQQAATDSLRHHQQQQQQQQSQQQRYCSNQNRWSVPISTSSRSVTVTSAAAPSIDRYAALKDLDDQFREIKLECETNNNHNNNNNIVNGTSNGMINGNHTSDVHQTSTANPFKSANPFQQQQQHQQQSVNWTIPGSASATGTTTNGFYATSPYQNGFTHANLINGNVPNGVSFTNAFHQPSSTAYGSGGLGSQVAPQFNGVTAVSMHQPLNHFGHFGNPFVTAGATTASSNSNNPFL
ncbi:uncharacterized protein DDB_G0283357 isoform X1 [Topomyia yanbarensis]|uniref:uncharacterized protein DDB_G0283357 isoform X1 n=1 Tax=Topomyia yanbarensis TaxID=2498891 RepID=UPI00273BCC98|nr:uncharacterized protein DDB_G0283357 isoform X1 [Topomyia yanbarensis]XP_058819634.1 uncharacterized protein DDB_G0283357 isoform X1 [Topomyia yanbarensis]XP_058819636.1 uncharacterized protein DDB_G0283357 isoform X1 [Topomyia yanbarensis]XP_058819637.1 uncharacterized protein DDB_G0283357 isoform X1 [Topomyia yanbarensis]XP_058819638.1 uncharacterized protein DDB_G0283357 isoform X1 [Topomyia yanbarensis]XP_058819639.1 uncharacterized protein DDB_G0283357 isoform X1 [Topomyia yanbarensis]